MDEVQRAAKQVLSCLESNWPASVDPNSVLVTGEGTDVAIVLIPHRQLGGFSLGVWTDFEGIELLWAWVTDLSTHDEIDLGARVARIAWGSDWDITLQRHLSAELERPITVLVRRPRFRRGLYCAITADGRTSSTYIGRPPPGFSGPEMTSLAATKPVSITLSVPLANWRKSA
jgi:hypothetical protein